MPWRKWMCATYAESLSLRDSVKCRNIITSPWFQRQWGKKFEFKEDENTKQKFANSKMGYRIATSVGGGVGEGADVLCLPYNSKISTECGQIDIGEIVRPRLPVRVVSRCKKTGKLVLRRITGYFSRKLNDRSVVDSAAKTLYRVTTVGGLSVTLSGNHPIYVPGIGYVRTENITAGNEVDGVLQNQVVDVVRSVEQVADQEYVFNISVEEDNNYFADGVRLHNCGDDLHKISEINSFAARTAVVNWWFDTFSTRGNDPKTVVKVLMAQRLRENDVSGEALAKGLGYEWLKVPLRYDPEKVVFTSLQKKRPELKDPRKEKGELLWPARFDEHWAKEQELTLGPWGSKAQLDQDPQTAGGTLIKANWFQYFTEDVIGLDEGNPVLAFTLRNQEGESRRVLAKDCNWFQTCDTAYLKGQHNDYTVIITFCLTPRNELLIYDVFRDKIEVPYQLGQLIKYRLKYPQLLFQAIEKRQSGIGLISQGRLSNTPFRVLTADGDKVKRSATAVTLYENGMIYHRTGEGASWLTVVEDELLRFPNGAHDDVVDCVSYGSILSVTDALTRMVKTVDEILTYPNPISKPDTVGLLGQQGSLLGFRPARQHNLVEYEEKEGQPLSDIQDYIQNGWTDD